MADWKFDSDERSGSSKAKAWGVDPDGDILALREVDNGSLKAIADSSDATTPGSSNYESIGIGTAEATDFPHIVSAKTDFTVSALSKTSGYSGNAEAASGARMVHHYEANEAGRATGTLKLKTELTGPFSELPDDTIEVTAGNSSISATYHSASGEWSVYGMLHTSTGVQTINYQVSGFAALDEEFSFSEAITRGSNFSIVAKINNGSPGDDLRVTSEGSLTQCEALLNGYVILDQTLGEDH